MKASSDVCLMKALPEWPLKLFKMIAGYVLVMSSVFSNDLRMACDGYFCAKRRYRS